MAEALAVVGLTASIVQLIDYGTRVVRRLNEFHSKLDSIPESFKHLKLQLPLVLATLKSTQKDVETNKIDQEVEEALSPVIDGCKEHIKSLDNIIDKMLPLSTDSLARRSKKAIFSLHQDSKMDEIASSLRNYIQTLTFYHSTVRPPVKPLKSTYDRLPGCNSGLMFDYSDEKLDQIRHWLSAPDPHTNYKKALKLRLANTGVWLLKSPQYVTWKANSSSCWIWLHGIPGCGKTVLSSTVIEDVLHYCSAVSDKAIAYFYFDFKDPQKQSSEAMTKSLVTQLFQRSNKACTDLEALYDSSNRGGRPPSVDMLLDILRRILEELRETYIVLDALDECADRANLMDMLETVAGWQVGGLHTILTSRR